MDIPAIKYTPIVTFDFSNWGKIFQVSKGEKGQFWCRHSSPGEPRMEKMHNTKSEWFMITYIFCFMHDPQIPSFYLGNLELGPLLDNFDGPVGPRAASNQKVA